MEGGCNPKLENVDKLVDSRCNVPCCIPVVVVVTVVIAMLSWGELSSGGLP